MSSPRAWPVVVLALAMGAGAAAGCGAAEGSDFTVAAPMEPVSPPALAQRVLADLPPPPPDGLTVPMVLEDPSGRALDALHRALERAARGERSARLLFYGGSHTASDLYTGTIRTRLQERFGNAGHGFVLPVPPINDYWQHGVRIADSEGWSVVQPSSKRSGVDHYGLAGMAFDASEPAWAEVETDRGGTASRVAVMFLRQPGGGALEVDIDGTTHVLATAAEALAPAIEQFDVPDASHRVQLRARGDGAVRLFGVVLERAGPGVIVDQLAIAGSKARHQLLWEETTWTTLLASRGADLVVVSYGNNELDDRHLSLAQHEQDFVATLERLRRHAPEASCVVLGPAERQAQGAGGGWKTPSALSFFVEMQRRITHANGCAFVDVLAWQGGPGAVERWLAASPPLEREDRVHFTDVGYRRLGADLLRVLLAGLAERDR